jgi:hypothetical protein
MLTREIPRNEWVSFFNNFSRNYHCWSVNIEVMGADIGTRVEVKRFPLEGIAVDLKSNGKDIISIIVGDEPDYHMSHTITAPTHVWVEQADSGEVLQIETINGPTTLLRFSSSLI